MGPKLTKLNLTNLTLDTQNDIRSIPNRVESPTRPSRQRGLKDLEKMPNLPELVPLDVSFLLTYIMCLTYINKLEMFFEIIWLFLRNMVS